VAEDHIKSVKKAIADNVRAFRQIRGIDQATVASHMESLGIAWRQVTVSEVERGERSVTVAELLALAFVLETTIEQLLDPRGPERIRGPWLSFTEEPLRLTIPDYDEPFDGVMDVFPPQVMAALVCTHLGHHEVEWGDDGKIKHLRFKKNDWHERAQAR
jgi:transcriptional regulator with XRE-family HTH domain